MFVIDVVSDNHSVKQLCVLRTEDLGYHNKNINYNYIYNKDNKHLQPYYKIYVIQMYQQPPTLDIENMKSTAKLCNHKVLFSLHRY